MVVRRPYVGKMDAEEILWHGSSYCSASRNRVVEQKGGFATGQEALTAGRERAEQLKSSVGRRRADKIS